VPIGTNIRICDDGHRCRLVQGASHRKYVVDNLFVELGKRETCSHNEHHPFIYIGNTPP
jgi:hypothetical protein